MGDISGESNGHNFVPSIEPSDRLTSEENLADVSQEISFEYPPIFCGETLLELCNSTWSRAPKAHNDVQPYLRGCKWSPDGTCCLTVVNNDGLHVTELPKDLYSGEVSANRSIDILDSIIHVKEAGLIYDFCWYPAMSSSYPETCFWITTRQNAPVQMWDAFDGSLKCSYRGFNAVDEMEPAISCTFSQDCTKIIGGYKKCLRTFDIDRPGKDFAEHKISSPASCLATNSNLLAVGSWNTTISLYNVNEYGTYKSIGKMHGHSGGITHMKFTPNGLLLVSGARKDHRLLVWDIRYYRRPLNVLTRAVATNQRVYFDISPCGKYLVSGGTDGILRVWNVDTVDWRTQLHLGNDEIDTSVLKFPLHKDCCNSVSIHPFRPILATGSGQYHFTDPLKLLSEENTTATTVKLEKTNGDSNQEPLRENLMEIDVTVQENAHESCISDSDIKYSSQTENCLAFWWTGNVSGISENVNNVCI